MALSFTIHKCKKNGAAQKKVYMTVTVQSRIEVQDMCEELTKEKGEPYTYLEHFE